MIPGFDGVILLLERKEALWEKFVTGAPPNHPWTIGQVERTIRATEDTSVKRSHHENRDELRGHLTDFLDAHNLARRLKTLSGRRP